jgi:hypothetical protein
VREAEAAVAFRFAPEQGVGIQLYRLPNLARVDWDFEGAGAATIRTVGFAGDEDLVYALTSAAELVTLDLTTGRTRVIDTSVVHATLGPTGTPYLVRADGTIGSGDLGRCTQPHRRPGIDRGRRQVAHEPRRRSPDGYATHPSGTD